MDDLTIKAALAELGVELASPSDDSIINRLRVFVKELERFNPVLKLVGDKGDDIWTRHVFDSLTGVKTLRSIHEMRQASGFRGGLRIADLGSGAGFPGIPLAIALPGFSFTLVERMERRCGFLRNALAMTGLGSDVRLIAADIREAKDKFNVVVMRAFHPLPDIIKPAAALLEPNGFLLAYRATSEYLESEIEAVGKLCPDRFSFEVISVAVPGLPGERRLCLVALKG